jgi:hypothetical protein
MLDALQELSAIGLELPSPAYLIGASLFGIIGWIAFRKGWKCRSPSLAWPGLALMFFPYAVSETWVLWSIGIALCAFCYVKWN